MVALVTLTACHQLTGGGYLSSAGDSTQKADFGFNLTCDSGTDTIGGSWVYHDKTPGGAFTRVAATGTITSPSTFECSSPIVGGTAEYELSYVVQGKCSGVCGGIADVSVTDTNVNGRLKLDRFSISFLTGPYTGYSNDGTIQGGNLKVS